LQLTIIFQAHIIMDYTKSLQQWRGEREWKRRT